MLNYEKPVEMGIARLRGQWVVVCRGKEGGMWRWYAGSWIRFRWAQKRLAKSARVWGARNVGEVEVVWDASGVWGFGEVLP